MKPPDNSRHLGSAGKCTATALMTRLTSCERLLQRITHTIAMMSLCMTIGLLLDHRAVAAAEIYDARKSTSVVIVLGLSESLNADVKQVISVEFSVQQPAVIDLSEQTLTSVALAQHGHVIAAGAQGCEQSIEAAPQQPVHCVLLTEERFRTILLNAQVPASRHVTALVIDQPVTRQAQVASNVYPALQRFSVLSESLTDSAQAMDADVRLDISQYRAGTALAPQLSDALSTSDALIAIADSSVFNRSTLRTVLLTAYGYSKPVIGVSRAYIKAGALITAYSTPSQIFREVAENLNDEQAVENTAEFAAVSYPRYFSIQDNVNVARSLRLTRLQRFDVNQTYTDRDLQP